MILPPAQLPSEPLGAHLVLYDGVCGLCHRLVQFLLVHDRRQVFCFTSLQSDTGKATVERWGGNPEDLTSFYVVADFRTHRARVLTKSHAALFVARELGWPWKALCAVRVLPTALRQSAYDVIARNRYRVFGSREHCMVPAPEVRNRFID